MGATCGMSEDERLTNIKDLLDSTLAEFESVFKSAGTFDQSRVGNGWTPASIPVQTYVIQAIPPDAAMKIAESRKSRLFGFLRRLGFRSQRIQLAGEPFLVYLPFWKVRGYHECFYFRGKTYKATVPEDVIAVQLGDRIRPLTSETKTWRSLVGKIKGILKRVLLGRPEPRYFTVDHATELAYQFREASVLVNGEGKGDVSMEYLLEKKPQMTPIERDELKDKAPNTKFTPPAFNAADAVELLHAKAVRPPPVFNKILTNRFEITELTLLELPVYVFRYKYLGRENEVRIHGATGELLK
jgi:hypothetical protein